MVVLYRPEAQHLENLLRAARQLSHLIVVDNTPERAVTLPESVTQVEVLWNRNRGGIAGALNAGLERAFQLGYLRTFLLDQDSSLPEGFVDRMLAFHLEHQPAISAPVIHDIHANRTPHYRLLSRFGLARVDAVRAPAGALRVSFAITSGQLLEMSEYRAAGPLAEELFIDDVDTEYCLRLQALGKRILVNPEVILAHSIGRTETVPLLGFRIGANNHSPLRRYYIARNSVLVLKRYFSRFPALLLLFAMRQLNELAAISVEDGSLAKLRAFARGFWDGLRNRSGEAQRAFGT